MAMNLHNIRAEDDKWAAASARAVSEGTNLSVLIRQWLQDYASGGVADAEAHYGRDKLITVLREQGYSLAMIADVTGLSPSGVSRALKRLGIKP